MRYAIICDVEKCCGCYSCFLACKDEHVGVAHLPCAQAQGEKQSWIRVEEQERGSGTKIKVDYIPIPCQHCENPPCAQGAPEGMVYRRADGIVILDPVKARGHRELVSQCPYGAIFYNEELDLPQKCTMCAHLLDRGEKTTRCVECCPTGALVFGDLDDPNSAVSRLVQEKGGELEALRPDCGTQTRVKYTNLPKPFLAGEVVCEGRDDCAQGVSVTLTGANGVRRTVRTNTFGDFEFQHLEPDTVYTVAVELEGFHPLVRDVRTSGSQNIGELFLAKV